MNFGGNRAPIGRRDLLPPPSPSPTPRVKAQLEAATRVWPFMHARMSRGTEGQTKQIGFRQPVGGQLRKESGAPGFVTRAGGRRQETLAAVNNPIKSGRKRRPATLGLARARLPASAIAAISSLLRYNAITLARRDYTADWMETAMD